MEFMERALAGSVRIVMGSVTVLKLCVPVIVNKDIQWWIIIVKMVRYCN